MKNERITIVVAEEEKERWKKAADKVGLDLSSYIRMTVKLDADKRGVE